MIISRGRQYIFVHIPKTGGTSLSLALEARAKADDILIGDTPKSVRRRGRIKALQGSGKLWKHSGLADVHGVVTDAEMSGFFVVTLVRNPWDRLVSYYHWLGEQNWKHRAVDLAKSLTFDDFLGHPEIQASFDSGYYASYVTDQNGREHCDLFVRLENMSKDIRPFEDHLGFRLGAIERVNTSPRRADYRSYYTDDTAALVARFCAKDIKRFGYSF